MDLPAPPVLRPPAGLAADRPVLAFFEPGREASLPLGWLAAAASGLPREVGAAAIRAEGGSDRPVVVAAVEDAAPQSLRRRAAEALALLRSHGAAACSVVLPGLGGNKVQAIAEGLFSANFRFSSAAGPARDRRPHVADIDFAADEPADQATAGLRAAWLTSLAALSARQLATEPANALTPPVFVERCRALAARAGFDLRVKGRVDLEAAGMGGLLAVAAGSAHEPFLVEMAWRPRGQPAGGRQEAARPLVLVGKTVTFDSGGISLKKPEDMDHMKADMGGGAAVFGAMETVAALRPDFPVTAIFAVVENMPGPGAMRPSDVIRTASGATVEIINTDAEGRLILADALHHAAGLDPAAVIDLATLTGASLGIFGPLGIGTFANDDVWFERLARADGRAGEKIWRLPLWPEYGAFLESPVADLRNFSTSGHNGGTPVAAAFLSRFVGAHPWLHLDLYNSSWNRSDGPLMPQGPSGSGARVLAQLIIDLASETTSNDPNPELRT